MGYSWYNGNIYKSENLKISTDDLGFLRGYGLFDYFRTYNRKPFQWDWYWERFKNSAEKLRIPLTLSQKEAESIISEITALSTDPELAFRLLLTGGDAPDSSTMAKPNLLIRSEKVTELPSNKFKEGLSIISHNYTRDMAEIKSTDYKRLLWLQTDLREKNAVDVLYHTNETLTEMSRSNIFLVKNGILKTPEKGILKGITRRTVLSLAKPDIETLETSLSLKDLMEADEVFTTSSNKKVLPITTVDGQAFKAGPVSEELLKRFNSLTASY